MHFRSAFDASLGSHRAILVDDKFPYCRRPSRSPARSRSRATSGGELDSQIIRIGFFEQIKLFCWRAHESIIFHQHC